MLYIKFDNVMCNGPFVFHGLIMLFSFKRSVAAKQKNTSAKQRKSKTQSHKFDYYLKFEAPASLSCLMFQ